jgi:hypothetical protein
MRCPACKNKISWRSISTYTNWYFKRLIDDCPHCHLKLIFVKGPIRTLNVAVLLLFGCIISYFLFSDAFISGGLGVLALCCFLYVSAQEKLKVARVSR